MEELSELPLPIRPGETIRRQLRIRNDGASSGDFRLELIGDIAWARLEPSSLTLAPGSEMGISIHFRPPRSPEVIPGRVPFVVSVRNQSDPLSTTWICGALEISAYHDLGIELSALEPGVARGWSHRLLVTNRGNTEVGAILSGTDPSGELRFEFESPELAVEANGTMESLVAVRPRRAIWWQQAARIHAFDVRVKPDIAGLPALVNEGRVVQRPVLPVSRRVGSSLVASVAVPLLALGASFSDRVASWLPGHAQQNEVHHFSFVTPPSTAPWLTVSPSPRVTPSPSPISRPAGAPGPTVSHDPLLTPSASPTSKPAGTPGPSDSPNPSPDPTPDSSPPPQPSPSPDPSPSL